MRRSGTAVKGGEGSSLEGHHINSPCTHTQRRLHNSKYQGQTDCVPYHSKCSMPAQTHLFCKGRLNSITD
jgi:hypothetical protein